MPLFCSTVCLALLCSAWFWHYSVTSPDAVNILVFPMDKRRVPCAARIEIMHNSCKYQCSKGYSPSGHYFSTILTFINPAFCPHSVFVCFVWISEQTAIISLYNINWLVCITETECVYCAVRTESLYTILRSAHTVYLCVLCGSQNKQPLFPYTTLTGWFV